MRSLLLLAGSKQPIERDIEFDPDVSAGGPLVSCLMVSRGGIFPARFAIDAFLRQTYSQRELVMICDTRDAPLEHYVEALGDDRIRFVATEPATLGELRNRSIAEAKGDIVAQWDDDDLCHPDRLAIQVAALRNGKAQAVFLLRWLMWWPARRWLAISGQRIWEGSMLARREAVPDYPALFRAEDTAMVTELRAAHSIQAIDAPHAYCYIAHGGNTWNAAHMEMLFCGATEIVPDADYERALDELGKSFAFSDWIAAASP